MYLPLFLLRLGQVAPGAACKVKKFGLGVACGILFPIGQKMGFVEVIESGLSADGVGVVGGYVVVSVGVIGGREGGGVRGEMDRWVAIRGGDRGEGGFVVGLKNLLEGGIGVELRRMAGE